MEVFNPNSNIDFLGWRKVSLTISLVLIVISVGMLFTAGLPARTLGVMGGVGCVGLFLMAKLMDRVERLEAPRGSVVRMTLHRE